MLSFSLFPTSAEPQSKKAAVELVGITRHDAAMYGAFESQFKAAHPELDVEIKWLEITTNAGWAKAIQSTSNVVDFCWGGGPTVFSIIANEGLLSPLTDTNLIDMIDNDIPDNIAGVSMNLKDENEDYLWVASALSSFGYTVNHENLDKFNLPMPYTWQDLADPAWFLGRTQFPIAMGNAPETTSNTRVYQIITQAFGWDMGWQIMTQMGANSKMTGESGPTRDSVISGPQAVAMTIDFYGYQAMSENPDCEYIIPKGQSIINGDPIAMASSVDDPEETQAFIEFVLSQEGQALWVDPRFNRLPIRGDAFTYAASNGNPREDLEGAYDNAITNVGIPFNESEAVANYDAFTYYFEATINDPHNELVDTWATLVDLYRNGDGTFSTAEFRSVIRDMCTPSITLEECIDAQNEYLVDPQSIVSFKTQWQNEAKTRYTAAKTAAEAEAADSDDIGTHFNPYSATISGVGSDDTLTTNTEVTMDIVDYEEYSYLYSTKDVDFYLDGVLNSTDNSTPFNFNIPVSTLADGPHSLMTFSTEHMGTAMFDYVNFNIDTAATLPAYSLTVPSGTINKTVGLNGSIGSDTTFVPSFAKFFIIDPLDRLITVTSATTGLSSFSVPFNTTLLANGDYQVFAVIGYESGNSVVVDKGTFTIFNEEITPSTNGIAGFELVVFIPAFIMVAVFYERRKKK